MKIRCDKCQTKYAIADEKVRGKVFKIKCKRCTNVIVVRGTDEEEPEPANFDQGETRVFDYGAGQNPEAAVSAGASDAVWYVVIDREQVGPVAASDIGDKWARAEVDADTYAWREGQADWARIGDIEEFKFLTAQGAAGSASGEMGGNPFAAPSSTADPADLFGGSGSSDEAAADLFGGSFAAPADAGAPAGGGDLFSAQSARASDLFAAAPASSAPSTSNGNGAFAGGGMGGGGGPRVEVSPSMTGQRNENSVLFSLANLASLATDTKAPNPTPHFQTGGSGNEGSGLIDIRAMAAMTVGASAASSSSASVEDDLPVFSASQFAAPAAGVLLPVSGGEERSNKLIYVLLAVIVFLVLAGGLGVYLLVTGQKQTVATGGGGGTGTDVTTPAGDDQGKTGPGDNGNPDNKGTTADNGGTTDTGDHTNDDGDDGGDDSGDKGDKGDKGSPASIKKNDKKHDKKDDKKDTKKDDKKDTKKDDTKVDEGPKSGKCDELECVLDPNKACCRKGRKTSDDKDDGGSKPSGGVAKLSRDDIKDGFRKVTGRVGACYDKYKVAGVIKVRASIQPSGSIGSAEAQGSFSGTPTGKCVEQAVKRAKFPKSQSSLTVTYPFSLN